MVTIETELIKCESCNLEFEEYEFMFCDLCDLAICDDCNDHWKIINYSNYSDLCNDCKKVR